MAKVKIACLNWTLPGRLGLLKNKKFSHSRLFILFEMDFVPKERW